MHLCRGSLYSQSDEHVWRLLRHDNVTIDDLQHAKACGVYVAKTPTHTQIANPLAEGLAWLIVSHTCAQDTLGLGGGYRPLVCVPRDVTAVVLRPGEPTVELDLVRDLRITGMCVCVSFWYSVQTDLALFSHACVSCPAARLRTERALN